jgi:hypothetical protein
MFICSITYFEISTVVVAVRVYDHEAYCPFEKIGTAAGLQSLSVCCPQYEEIINITSTVHHFSFWRACSSFIMRVFAIVKAGYGDGRFSLQEYIVYCKGRA